MIQPTCIAAWLSISIVIALSSGVDAHQSSSACHGSAPDSTAWDHFVFTQQWPASTCLDPAYAHKGCTVPDNVQTWTVHGLWPNEGDTKGPQCCDPNDSFNPDSIQSIQGDLDTYWPNLFGRTSGDQFWQHEWEKHGTCAKSIEAVNSEYKYFDSGLALRQQYDILAALAQANIVPSDQPYQYSDFVTALNNQFTTPKLQCFTAEGTQYISQIELCLDQSFHMIQCPGSSHSSCHPNKGIVFPPPPQETDRSEL